MRLQPCASLFSLFFLFFLFFFLFLFVCFFKSTIFQTFLSRARARTREGEMLEVNYRQALLGGYVISRDALSALFYSGQYGGRSRNSRGQIKVYFAPLNSVSSTRSCYISCIWCFL